MFVREAKTLRAEPQCRLDRSSVNNLFVLEVGRAVHNVVQMLKAGRPVNEQRETFVRWTEPSERRGDAALDTAVLPRGGRSSDVTIVVELADGSIAGVALEELPDRADTAETTEPTPSR